MSGTQVTTGEISRASVSLEGTPLLRGDSMKPEVIDTGLIERNPGPTVTMTTEKNRGPTETSQDHAGMSQAHIGTIRGPAERIRGPTETIHGPTETIRGPTGTIRDLIRNPATLRPPLGPAIMTRSDQGGQDRGRGAPSSPVRPSARRNLVEAIRFGTRRYAISLLQITSSSKNLQRLRSISLA